MSGVVIVLLIACPASAQDEVTVSAMPWAIEKFDNFVAEKGGDPLAIDDFTSSKITRSVVDLVLIHQALALGGSSAKVRMVPVPNPARAIDDVKGGTAVIYNNAIWESDFDDTVYKSAPMIRKGEFELGVFTSPDNEGMLNVRSLDELLRFRPVLSQSWTEDIALLKRMGFGHIHTPPTLLLVYKALAGDRADFCLLAFSKKPDGSRMHKSIRIVQVPGIKVIFPQSRHFMVSRKHRLGAETFAALERGLKVLRKRGVITRAYRQSGVFRPDFADWTNLAEGIE